MGSLLFALSFGNPKGGSKVRRACVLSLALGLLLALALLPVVASSEKLYLGIAELEGEILDVHTTWNEDGGIIETVNTLAVSRVLQGKVQTSEIVIGSYGGEYDNLTQFATGWPRFIPSEWVWVKVRHLDGNSFIPVYSEVNKMALSSPPAESSSEELGYVYTWDSWLTMPIDYYINEDGTGDTTGEFGQVTSADYVWDKDPGSYFELSYQGTTDKSPSSHFDSTNTVGWVPSLPGNAVGLTTCFAPFDLIVECDMELNDLYTWSTNGAAGTYDVKNAAAHEFGHWIILDDLYGSGDSEETMYGYIDPGETKKRDLHWGDAAGVRFVYRYRRDAYSVGWYTQGADVEIGKFGGLSYRYDALIVHVDNPSGNNYIHYRYGYDLYPYTGEVSGGYSSDRTVPGSIGHETSGVGVAVGAIGDGSEDDMTLAWVDNPSGADKIYYKIGWDIQSDGNPSYWSYNRAVSGSLSTHTYGLGADLANIDGDSNLDLVLSWVGDDGAVYYKIGWDLSTQGWPSYWSSTRNVFAIERNWAFGAGVRFADIDANGGLDAVFQVTVRVGTDYLEHFKIAWDISSSGWFSGMTTTLYNTELRGGSGAGVGIVSLHYATPLEILMVAVEGLQFSDSVAYQWT